MPVKRERELSPTDQPTNKAKTKPTTPKKARSSSSSTTPSASPASKALSKEDKAQLVRCAMDHVYKTMNFVEIAAEVCISLYLAPGCTPITLLAAWRHPATVVSDPVQLA